MKVAMAVFMVMMTSVLLPGCEPDGQSPGLWLGGTLKPFAEDWRFTDSQGEISLEISSPYLLPHSVTIWCAQLDGNLYLAAGQAATKNWPGWVDDAPDVVLKVGEDLYEARLKSLTDEAEIVRLQAAFAEKYNLGEASSVASTTSRYWSVQAR
jgi:hypothetical protein